MNPYRDGKRVAPRSRWWRFRMWVAELIAPAKEPMFLDRWDITDGAKQLALAWDRGYLGRVEWNPPCSNCGTPAPLESHCRECGSLEREIKDRAHELERRIHDMQHRLEYVKRRDLMHIPHDHINPADGVNVVCPCNACRPKPPKMPKAPQPVKVWR